MGLPFLKPFVFAASSGSEEESSQSSSSENTRTRHKKKSRSSRSVRSHSSKSLASFPRSVHITPGSMASTTASAASGTPEAGATSAASLSNGTGVTPVATTAPAPATAGPAPTPAGPTPAPAGPTPVAAPATTPVSITQAQLDKLNAKNAELAAQINTLVKAAKVTKKPKNSGAQNDTMVTLIREKLKAYTFKEVKFVQDEAGEQVLLDSIIHYLDIPELKADGEVGKAAQEGFKNNYLKTCLQELNNLRNYVQSQAKKKAFAYMASNKGKLPEMADIINFSLRRLDLEDPKKLEFAFWWMNNILPTFPGCADYYNKKIRHYETISEAKTDKECPFADITEHTEAFGVLSWENNSQKWPKLYALENKRGNEGKKTVLTKKKVSEIQPEEDKRFFSYTETPELATLYTMPDAGQEKYGGWKPDGLKRYVLLRKNIRKARAKAEGKAWEKKLLALCREKLNIKGKDYAEQRKLMGKRKTKTPVAAPAAIDLFEEEEDGESDIEIEVV